MAAKAASNRSTPASATKPQQLLVASYRIKHTAIESLPSFEAERQADSTP